MVAAALLGVGVSRTPQAKAANLYWDSDGTSGNLATDGGGTWASLATTNFFDPLKPLQADGAANNLDIAYFGYSTGAGGTVNVDSSFTIAGLVFGPTLGSNVASGYTLSASAPGSTLTVGASGISLNAGGLATTVGSANLSLALGAGQSWINNSSNNLTIAGSITNGANLLTLQATSGGNLTVSEAHGYGMMLAALMAGYDPEAQSIFDGLFAFYRDHPSSLTPGLMA